MLGRPKILKPQENNVKKLEAFSSTEQFIKYVTDLLSKGGQTKEAGDLFEQFAREWHLEFGEYIAIYDSNAVDTIPSAIINKIDAFEILNKGANSFGIDKICITRTGEIDIHQDKSSLHTDRKLSANKATGMMSLRNNPLKNIRHFVINTTAKDLSHYAKLWKEQTPLCYGYDSFVPDENDAEAVKRDQIFWQNVKAKRKNKPTQQIFGFVSRGPEQDDYIAAGKKFAVDSMSNNGYAKWHQLGCGALGKSVLDAVLLAELEYLFNPIYTKTPKPVSVSFYHSSKTLPKNGWEEVQRRRAKGIYDEVIVISGTNVVDGENDNFLSTPFPKTIKAHDAVVKIIDALKNNKSVLLLTLYHHAGQVEQIKNLLNKYYPGFKYWYRKRDECDWPCGDPDNSYAPALDHRTESVLTFGSSGTERLGKDPIKDYGLNNTNIHGVCAHKFTWAQAETGGLVKPLILVLPCIKESEVAQLFPEFTDNNGRVDWNMRVKGVAVDGTLPTAGLIADLTAMAKTLVEYPEIKRILTFSHQVKTNKLAELNWLPVCRRVLDNSTLGRSAKNLFWQVLNDDAYTSISIKDHTVSIKRAKSHKRYAIGSCRVFGRGYDDKFSPKHHAAIHFDAKTIVNTVQEIWRVTRLDQDSKTNKPVDGDPNAYYILPMRYNDVTDTPSFSEDRLEQLMGILQQNKNIFDEFQILMQQPNGSRRKQVRGSPRIWMPEDFDVTAFSGLISWITMNSRGTIKDSLIVDAHNWITMQKLSMSEDEINDNKKIIEIRNMFYDKEEFKPMFDYWKGAKNRSQYFYQAFFNGEYVVRKRGTFSQETIEIIQQNIIEVKLHRQQCENNRKEKMETMIPIIENEIRSNLYLHRKAYNIKDFETRFNVPFWIIGKQVMAPLIKKLEKDKTHWRNQQRKVYELLLKTADISSGQIEWAKNAHDLFEQNGINSKVNTPLIILKNFVRKDCFKVLTAKEWKKFRETYDVVKYKQYQSVAFEREQSMSGKVKEEIAKKRLNTIIKRSKSVWRAGDLGDFPTKVAAAKALGVDASTYGSWITNKKPGFEKVIVREER